MSLPVKIRCFLIRFIIISGYASSVLAGGHYNRNEDGALPAALSPAPEAFDYAGSLDFHWFADLASDNETVRIDSDAAIAAGASELVAAPDNCWGMNMHFGLLRLKQAAILTITMTPDSGSRMIPGFALYQGWDSSRNANRHSTIYFANNGVPPGLSGAPANGRISTPPLGTLGLSFLGDILGAQAGEPIKQSFTLQPGKYEIFVTVGNNHSISGRYAIMLETRPQAQEQPQEPVIPVEPGQPEQPPQTEQPPQLTEGPAECGSANALRHTDIPSPSALCAHGSASQTQRLRDGRYTWLCSGSEPAVRCYTLGANGKLNQAPLVLTPGSQTATLNSSIVQSVMGGSGRGRIRYRQISASDGTHCKLVPKGKSVAIRLRGKPGACQLMAIKGKSRKYNDVESTPITITVTP